MTVRCTLVQPNRERVPAAPKPRVGGGWRDIYTVATVEQLAPAYAESG